MSPELTWLYEKAGMRVDQLAHEYHLIKLRSGVDLGNQ
jgi:hypothetical protein